SQPVTPATAAARRDGTPGAWRSGGLEPDTANDAEAHGTGAVLGGFILGFTEVVAVAIFPELGGYKDAFAFLFLILVLLFRPVGIMGDERLERSRF
ncbi:hypothetical protein LAN14_22290, partial [Mycobacterium tuberculosis]|nr:hypothetical protein [Mycobacterium tuberculosis]